jgi:hypothetical protein
MDRNRKFGARLLLHHIDTAVDDILPVHPHNVAGALAGVKQQGICEPLSRPQLPSGLKGSQFFV